MCEDIDCDYTNEIVCPYCGHEKTNSWEYDGDDGEIECDECGMKFAYVRNVSVDYSTSKLCKENGKEHQWGEWGYHESWESNGIQYGEFWHRTCKVCSQIESVHENPLTQKG